MKFLLENNFRYGNGFIKEDAENEIRSKIQDLSLKIIKYQDCPELLIGWKKEREEYYNILGGKTILRLVK